MQMTMTYSDLIAAAQARLTALGVSGEVIDVKINVARKDPTKTTVVVTLGTAEEAVKATAERDAHSKAVAEAAAAKKPAQAPVEQAENTSDKEADEKAPEAATASAGTGSLFPQAQ